MADLNELQQYLDLLRGNQDTSSKASFTKDDINKLSESNMLKEDEQSDLENIGGIAGVLAGVKKTADKAKVNVSDFQEQLKSLSEKQKLDVLKHFGIDDERSLSNVSKNPSLFEKFLKTKNIQNISQIPEKILNPISKYSNLDINPIYADKAEEFIANAKQLPSEAMGSNLVQKILKIAGPIAAAKEYADSGSAFQRMMNSNLNWKQRTGAGLKGLGGSVGLGALATEVASGGAATPIAIPAAIAGGGAALLGNVLENYGNEERQKLLEQQNKIVSNDNKKTVDAVDNSNENIEPEDLSNEPEETNEEYTGETNQEARKKLLETKQQLGSAPQEASEQKNNNLNNLVKTISDDKSGLGLEILNALRSKGESESTANMLRAVQMIANAASGMGSKVVAENKSDQFFKDLLAQSNKPIEDLSTRLQLEEYDPNSPAAQNMRDYLNSTLEMAGLTKVNLKGMNIKQMEKLASAISSLGYHMGVAKEKKEATKIKEQSTSSYKDKALKLKIQTAANNTYDKNTKDEVSRIQGADRAMAFIDKIEKGELVPSKNVRGLLTREIAQLAMPSGLKASVSAQQATEINTLYGSAKDLASKILGHPTDTIPNSYLKQLKIEINLLKEKYGNSLAQKTDSLIKGADNDLTKELYVGRTSALIPTYKNEYTEESIEEKNNEIISTDKEIINKFFGGNSEKLKEYANQHFNGNIQAATKFLMDKNRGK